MAVEAMMMALARWWRQLGSSTVAEAAWHQRSGGGSLAVAVCSRAAAVAAVGVVAV